jgi:hypothetical protein
MATPNVSEIMTTTLESRTKKLADNVSENNAILNRLNKRGNVKPFSGGRVIYQELDYAENSTYKRYSGYETLNISPSEVFTAAEFDIKQAAVAISISGLEQLQNSGPEQMIDLLESRIVNAEKTMQNNLSSDLYSDGTADGGKQIGGLQLLVADTPTSGTVGGINRLNWTFWRNQSFDATTDGGAAVTAANIQSYMNTMYLRTSRGTDHSDLIIADNNYYNAYWQSLQAIQRVGDSEMADAGFQTLKFMGADVVFDGGYGGAAPANHMYFLNTNYIFWRPHRDRNMVPLNPDRFAVNQDAMVKLIAVAGNLTTSNCFLQGLIKD